MEGTGSKASRLPPELGDLPGRRVARYLRSGVRPLMLLAGVASGWLAGVLGGLLLGAGLRAADLPALTAAAVLLLFGFAACAFGARRLARGYASSEHAGARPVYGMARIQVLAWTPFWLLAVMTAFLGAT